LPADHPIDYPNISHSPIPSLCQGKEVEMSRSKYPRKWAIPRTLAAVANVVKILGTIVLVLLKLHEDC
jgi:hypothetical protein